MNETSRETNHKFLYGVNFIYFIFGIIMIALAAANLVSSQLMSLFPFVEPTTIATTDMGALMVLASVLGVWGTRRRSKRILILWTIIVICVTIAEIIVASLMTIALSNDTFDDYAGTTFLANWKSLVTSAETNSEDLAWIKEIQIEGTCCGWLDIDDEEENPAYLECDTSYTTTCSVFFKDAITSQLGSLESIALAISILQFLFIVTVITVICRFKEYYKGENMDFGDYKHIPYGSKPKRIEELIA